MASRFLVRLSIMLLLCGFAAAGAFAQAAYPESADGLKALLQDIFAAVKANDTQRSTQLLASLAIPNHREWFMKIFGPTEGARLEVRYIELGSKTADWLKSRFDGAVKNGKTEAAVKVFQKPAEPSSPLLKAVVEAMVAPAPLYEARGMKDSTDSASVFLGDFFHVDGSFRYVDGQVFVALSNAPPMRITIGGNVQAAKIVSKVQPVYPDDAKRDHIEGTVALQVAIGPDGGVKEAALISGQPALAQSAIDAVKQWRYQPTLLNGKPVEVLTQVNIVFSLAP